MADINPELKTGSKAPAFQFYPNDFTTGTLTLTTEEVGAYMLLMCYCWDNGSIPSDFLALSRIARVTPVKMRRMWLALKYKFYEIEGGYTQARIEKERAKQAEYRRRQGDKGRASGASRRNHGSTAVQPNTNNGSTGVEPRPVPVATEPDAKSSSSISDLPSSVRTFRVNSR